MNTVCFPGGTSLPLSSLPSHLSVYLPGERVALETDGVMSLPSVSARRRSECVHDFRSGSHLGLAYHSASVRTGNLSLSSIQMATYGRFARPPSNRASSKVMSNSQEGSQEVAVRSTN